MKKVMLDKDKAREFSDLGHVAFINAFLSVSKLNAKKFAFHGGTSLHLSWKSPRFSEDLDFLLSKDMGKEITDSMGKIEGRLLSLLHKYDPNFSVQIRDKTKDGSRLLNFMINISHASYHGNVKIKAEFWQVEQDYLDKYQTKFAYPASRADYVSVISQPIPAATLESAYADKLTAFATRPHLKWRDLFDLWWLDQQVNVSPEEMTEKFIHHLGAYKTVNGLSPSGALLHFLSRDENEIIDMADPDLKKWLPDELWQMLEGKGVREIVSTVRDRLGVIAEQAKRLEEHDNDQHVQP